MGKEKELPQGWLAVQLNDVIAKPQYGWTSKSTPRGRIKYLRTTDLSKGTVDWDTVPYCKKEPEDVDKYQLKTGDIVVSRAGSVGLSFLLLDPPDDAVFASYLIRLRPIAFPSKFLAYFLKSPRFWSVVHSVSSGIAVQNINATKLKEMSFPLPPLPEQHRIVAKLDALMARVAALEAGLARIPQLLAHFRQSVLSKAVTGALTEEWRAGKALGEWKKEVAAECCHKVQSGGTPKKEFFADTGIPFLKVYNIVNQKIDFVYRPQFITKEIHATKSKKSIAYPGDVLMNIVGPPLGKIAILTDEYPEWNHNQAITLFRPKPYLHNKFLYYFFCEGTSVRSVHQETRGVVGQSNISLSQCRAFEIPIPPAQEQAEIVRRVESLFAKADAIEERYEALKQKVETLPQAILAKAFRGELVPQLPEDGDARDLLAEIRGLREGKSKKNIAR